MNKKDINILKNNNINLDIALEYFTNINTYNEMLRLWLLSSNKKIIRLIEAINSNDKNLINTMIYNIHSDAECYGFRRIETVSDYYLEKTRANDYDYIKENINKLINLIENMQEVIEKYFNI